MVVLSAAVLTKGGKTLLARQFVAMTRPRIEGLLAAFPKLVAAERAVAAQEKGSSTTSNSSSSTSSERTLAHTYVETDSVRYLYQALEQLYIVVVTNKASNILADLETLHLLSKLVPEFAYGVSETDVLKHAFDIVNAFDECVTMGQRERVSVQQVKHFCSMESHDEERFKADEAEKLKIAAARAKDERKKIEQRRAESRKMESMGSGGLGSQGFGSGSSSSSMGSQNYGGMGSGGSAPTIARAAEPAAAPADSRRPAGAGLRLGASGAPGGGVRLGGAGGYSSVLEEEDVPDRARSPASPAVGHKSAGGSAPAAAPSGSGDPVSIVCRETIQLNANNDGGLESLVIQGELCITVHDEACNNAKIKLSQADAPGFQLKTHPNMEKAAFQQGVLALRQGRTYPLNTESSILKWRLATTDDNVIPLRINVWPSTQAGQTVVPVEFEKTCDFPLHDVEVIIPIPGQAPIVSDVFGSADFDQKRGHLIWRIPLIDNDEPGSLEFTVPAADHGSFLPVTVTFTSDELFCPIKAVAVAAGEGQRPKFSATSRLTTEEYQFH